MNYTLYLTQASDGRETVYSYTLHNFEGEKAAGTFLALGRRRNDMSYCGHIALQRALRSVAKIEGVISLKVIVDHPLLQPIVFETMGIDDSLHPTLCQTTNRMLKRFASYELASADFSGDDATWQEVATLDNALDSLEQNKTVKGRWQIFRDLFFNSQKIIR
ncbi:hypothetical protein [Bacillus sonorensis]|uniref:hypothetical protein n=1 Tax=Bacillus sonorensis TaxID=119858 RepID=UPI002A69DD63|nr:hypothetical protein [Bacillus sonorensis]WPP36099.1 hypothetical protein SK061_21320 [Bacillus sonorensis]